MSLIHARTNISPEFYTTILELKNTHNYFFTLVYMPSGQLPPLENHQCPNEDNLKSANAKIHFVQLGHLKGLCSLK